MVIGYRRRLVFFVGRLGWSIRAVIKTNGYFSVIIQASPFKHLLLLPLISRAGSRTVVANDDRILKLFLSEFSSATPFAYSVNHFLKMSAADLERKVALTNEKVVGNGSFGVVFQATLVETGETVAVKKVLQDKRFKVLDTPIQM